MAMNQSAKVDEEYRNLLKQIVGDKASPRNGIVETITEALNHKLCILTAPTGYGKTFISYTIGSLTVKSWEENPCRAIHVLPLRSIIEHCYIALFNEDGTCKVPELNNRTVAKQMMGAAQSPWLQKPLVLTTFDTFSLSCIRVPPAEIGKIFRKRSQGHGYISLASILTSVIVFDELHLFLEENLKGLRVILSVINALRRYKTPIIIMSATMPSKLRMIIVEKTREKVPVLEYGQNFKDEEFEEFKKKTLDIIETPKPERACDQKIAEKAIKAHECYNKVLTVVNNVSRCIEIARCIEETYSNKNVVVLHSKIIAKDRRDRLKKLESNTWIAVCTQVVEAGVDVSSHYMITDIAPPCALVQRAGRLLRSKKDIEKFEGDKTQIEIVYDENRLRMAGGSYGIYNSSLVNSALNALNDCHESMAWHLPYVKDKTGYTKFIEHVYDVSEYLNSRALKESLLVRDIVLNPMLSIRESVNLAIRYNWSLIRERPPISGFVDAFGVLEEKMFSTLPANYMDYILSMSIYDLDKLSQALDGKLYALRFNSSELSYEVIEYKREDLNIGGKGCAMRVMKRTLVDNVLSFIIPENLYDHKYGLHWR